MNNLSTIVTPDHKYWISNLNDLNINTIKKGSINKLIQKK